MRAKRAKALRRLAARDWLADPRLRKVFSVSDGNACNPFRRFFRALKRQANAERGKA